jgi:L-alanine-DL-glutamate epimerase-like enolase superfamily enzyme
VSAFAAHRHSPELEESRPMSRPTDVHVKEASLFFLPLQLRVPLKFGTETVTNATCARVRLRVADGAGRTAEGWGETPLSASWVWPSALPFETRETRMKEFCVELARRWPGFNVSGHPMEIGHAFIARELDGMLKTFNSRRPANEAMPWLGALVCDSAFDIALHDAYGILHGVPAYETYTRQYMSDDLSAYLKPAEGTAVSFAGKYPADFLTPRRERLSVWHLIGGKDPVDPGELTGAEPKDGYPTLLRDWIRADGLKCLKIKLRGNDAKWDYERTLRVGKMAIEENVDWLTADFNCTVSDPAYVNDILDRLKGDAPRIYGMLLYVEQPFPYDLDANRIDVHSVAARKPLFMDESAHDWHLIQLGRSLGWTGVALKTCKTQTGALLSLCWAKAHGMTLMVQDLTNPMLAIIPHALLAAHAGTIMGVEANAMQFYPEGSKPEEAVHPGLYRRREGVLDLSTIRGPGFGYRLNEIKRTLPEAAE